MAFRFLGGRPSLDFVGTQVRRFRPGGGIEQLATPEDLGHWFCLVGLVSDPPAVSADLLLQARELRDAIYRLVRPDTRETPRQADIDLLNLVAAHCGLRPMLRDDARSARMVAEHPARACLAALAADAINLLSSPQINDVRECIHTECSVLFLDSSRSRQRRWCDMRRCGNRTKAARYRQRSRAPAIEAP